MPTMAEVRAKFPQYNDMSDQQLAGALHKKFYSDMPEAEFNAKVGLSAPQAPVQAQAAPTPGYGEDMLRSAGSGLRSGVEGMAGMLGDAAQTQGDIAAWAVNKMGGSPETQDTVRRFGRTLFPTGQLPSTADIQAGTNAVVGEGYKPQTMPGEYARTVAQFAPNMLSPGTAARKVAATVVPALVSETAGQFTKGTAAEPYARGLGALAGGVATAGRGANAPKPVAPAPAAEAMAADASNLYTKMRETGITIKPEKIAKLKANIGLSLSGTNPDLAPKAFGLRRLADETLAGGVAAHGNSVSINNLLRSADRLKLAEADIAKGAGTRSTGAIHVSKSPDGRLLVVDGYHRLAEAARGGETSIAVEHVPWTDTFGRVLANEKGRFIEPGPGVGELHNLAKSVNRVLRSKLEGEDAHYVGLIKTQIENAIETMTAGDIKGGGTEAFSMWKQADKLWARQKKTAVVENILDSADAKTGQYTQSGLANTIRKEMATLYKSIQSGRTKGFTADEIALVRQMAKGGSNSQAVNLLAKFAPRGVVSTLGGFALGGPALTLAGHVGGVMADKGALTAATKLRDATARGYIQQTPQIPFDKNALIRFLMSAKTGENSAQSNSALQ